MKTLLKPLGKSVLATVVFFAVLEVFLRGAYYARNLLVSEMPLPYVVGADYGPTPPWIDGLRMIEADGTLLWRGRPRFHQKYIDSFAPVHTEDDRRAVYRRFLPSLPSSLAGRPSWEISLNSEGFRDSDFPKEKPPSAFRILCLGDSWTVGSNVNAEDAFPQRLKAMLKKEFPGADFEVFNMGMFGYTSVNGLRMMKRALELRPDVLVLGFAMNEAKTAGVPPGSPPGEAAQGPARLPAAGALKKEGFLEAEAFASKHIEFYKLLKYYAQLLMWKPISMGQHFQDHAEAFRKFQWMNDNADADPWMRRLMDGYERNYREMIRLAGTQSARVVLLYPEFRRDAPFLRALRKISEEKGLPLVDGSLLIAQARKAIEDGLEGRLGLQPQLPPAGGGGEGEEAEVTFRVYAGD
ncbi:MAG: GDSL-type esterase/lipase family protein, partial [Nitrospinota bacterium]